jgi:hypothetical protein
MLAMRCRKLLIPLMNPAPVRMILTPTDMYCHINVLTDLLDFSNIATIGSLTLYGDPTMA